MGVASVVVRVESAGRCVVGRRGRRSGMGRSGAGEGEGARPGNGGAGLCVSVQGGGSMRGGRGGLKRIRAGQEQSGAKRSGVGRDRAGWAGQNKAGCWQGVAGRGDV